MARVSSVSRKLVLSVAVPLVLFFALTLLVLDHLFRDLSTQAQSELLDEQMVSLVSTVEAAPGGKLAVDLPDPESRLLTPGSGHYATVRSAQGEVLWSSPSLTGIELDFGRPLAIGERGFVTRAQRDGTVVRILSRGLRWEAVHGRSRDLVFSVAESLEPYRAQLTSFRQTMVGWFVIMTVLLLAVLGWLLRLTLAPVRRLEREISEVEAGAREQLGGGYPRELAGTTANLNTLLVSERQRIARYRDTLGNLAHELKTPLAVMRTVLRQEQDSSVSINREIDRMTKLIDRQLARAAGGGGATLGQAPLPVAPLASELRATLLKVHSGKDLMIDLQVQPGAAFLGDGGDLTELLGNLLDNACKWCRSTVRLQASVEVADDTHALLLLCVDDDGPGVDPADRRRILARGVRADERAAGHGLGLAIVSDTVALYNSSLTVGVAPQLGGARFEVRLPGRLISATA
jgi:two-component system sensor histidine kinase PhoQ